MRSSKYPDMKFYSLSYVLELLSKIKLIYENSDILRLIQIDDKIIAFNLRLMLNKSKTRNFSKRHVEPSSNKKAFRSKSAYRQAKGPLAILSN